MTVRKLDGLDVVTDEGVRPVEAGEILGRRLKYYDYCMAAFAVILICSNLIGAGKVATVSLPLVGAVTFGAGILFFPLGYVLGDVLTEVYGYARARRVVWVGFVASLFAGGMAAVVVAMPPAADWTGQEALATVMGQVPRILAASVLAFWAGEFANAFVLARMKLLTGGRMLWTRTIGSTAVGQGVDSLIFYPLAFLGGVGNQAGADGDGDQLSAEGGLGSGADAGDLRSGGGDEAWRRSGRVRRGDGLYAVQDENLTLIVKSY